MKKGVFLVVFLISILAFSVIVHASVIDDAVNFVKNIFSPQISTQEIQGSPLIDKAYDFEEPRFMAREENTANSSVLGLENESEIYYAPSISNTNIMADPGYPEIPYRTVKLLIPNGENIEDIEIAGLGKTYAGIYNLDYGKNILKTSLIDDINLTINKNNQIYSLDTEYPGLNSSYEIQKLDGYSILIFNIYPMQYIPSTGDVYYYKSIEVKVYTSSISQVQSVSETNYPSSNINDIQRVKAEVDNSENVRVYTQAGLQTESSGQNYDYIIITNKALNSSNGIYRFQDLINWKESKGLSAGIFTVEDILSNHNYDCDGTFGDGCAESKFNDTAAHIRNFIRDMYRNHGTRYVLLGGDGDGADVGGQSGNNIIPARLFYPRFSNGGDSTLYNSGIAADNYYSNLDGSFDSNLNGYFGEPTDGVNGIDIDLYAEVFVGRASVDNTQELSNFVGKTIWFENYTMHQSSNYTQVDDYLKKFLLAGEYLGFGGDSDYASTSKEEVRTGSSAYNYTTVGIPDQFDTETLYDAYHISWSKTALMNEMNSGVQIINHLGHGSSNYVMKLCEKLASDCTYCDPLNQNALGYDLDNLTNNKFFFIYSQACYPGSFDNWNYAGCYSGTDSIGENFVGMAHGAFATVMNSRYGWGMENSTDGAGQRFDRQFFNEVFAKGNTKLGVANQYSKEDNIGGVQGGYYDNDTSGAMRWEYYDLTLLGDPETSLYIPPQAYHNTGVFGINVSQILLPKVNNNITVTVYNSENAAETNVSVSLLIDNNIVDTKNISYLSGNTSQDVNFIWFSNIGGAVNISASTLMAGDEKPWDNYYSISVYVTPFALTGNFFDFANDTDGSGLNDTILVGIEIDSVANESGASFLGQLYDNDGVYVNVSYSGGSYMSYNGTSISMNRVDNINLTYGINIIWIPFYTYIMRTNNISNTMNLKYLSIYYRDEQGGHNTYPSNLYNTSFYDYREFDDIPIRFTQHFFEYPYDSDKNGKYDYLVLAEGINVSLPGTYRIGYSIINNQTVFVNTEDINFSTKGLYNLSIPVLGPVINFKNASGIFNLTSKAGVIAGTVTQLYNLDSAAYLSKNYNSNNFEGTGGYLTNNYSDQAIDTDGDRIYDFLRIGVGINVTRDGIFSVSGSLYNSSNRYLMQISQGMTTKYLEKGLQTIYFYIPGNVITYNYPYSPYYSDSFRLVNLALSYFGNSIDSRSNPYNTSTYYSGNFTYNPYPQNYTELAISSVSLPRFLEENKSFPINLVMTNSGNNDTSIFNISFFDGANLLNKLQVNSISKYNYSASFTDYINLSEGVHTIYVVADSENNLKEYFPQYSKAAYSVAVVGNPNRLSSEASISISTDKNSYNFGERVYLTN